MSDDLGDVLARLEAFTEEAMEATHIPDLMAFADGIGDLSKAVAGLRTAVEGRVHDLLAQLGGSLELADGRVLTPWERPVRVRTDGARIRGVLVAQAAREFGGETPEEFAQMVSDLHAACAGLDNASQSWRKGALGRRGVPLERFQTSEPGAKTFRVKLADETAA